MHGFHTHGRIQPISDGNFHGGLVKSSDVKHTDMEGSRLFYNILCKVSIHRFWVEEGSERIPSDPQRLLCLLIATSPTCVAVHCILVVY